VPGRRAGAELFVARQAFATQVNGVTIVVQPGQLVDSDDPILKGRAELFEPFVPKVRQYPGQARVEQATAAPGEKRQ
jgi:hypothetical protein